MEANAGLVAGSHKRNELVMIRREGESGSKPLKNLNGQICQICGDIISLTEKGDVFVACNECAFPVCRPCYEYERKEGNKCCPQCKTGYKRHIGSPRVEGDDEEDDVDDLDNEFNYPKTTNKATNPWSGGREEVVELSSSSRHEPYHHILRLTSGQQVSGEMPDATPDNLSIRSQLGPLGSHEKCGPTYLDPSLPVPVRIVDPSKDLNSYGLGSVDWKERVEGWKLKQDKNIMNVPSKYTDGKGDMEGTGSNGEDLQIYDRDGEPSQLVPIDIFVSTVDPLKEPPLITTNTVLSILAVDYPIDKVSCYVSDDGFAMLTFEALSETAKIC